MKKLLLSIFALTSLASYAQDEVKLELTGNDQMMYSTKELTVVTGQKVTLEFKNVGTLPKVAMGHNVIILQPGTELPAFAMKCAPAAATDYIPQDEESKKLIFAHSKLLGPGETDTITFTAPAPGEYPYLCSFPGHFAMMNGKLIVKAKE